MFAGRPGAGPGVGGGEDAAGQGQRAASPGPELSPPEPGAGRLAAGHRSAWGCGSWQNRLSQLPPDAGWPGEGARGAPGSGPLGRLAGVRGPLRNPAAPTGMCSCTSLLFVLAVRKHQRLRIAPKPIFVYG